MSAAGSIVNEITYCCAKIVISAKTQRTTYFIYLVIYFQFTLPGCGLNRQRSFKSGGKKRRKVSSDEVDDEDDDSRDWWSKYFASIEATIEVGRFTFKSFKAR